MTLYKKQKLLLTVSSTRVIRFLIKTPFFETLKQEYDIVFLSDLPLDKMGLGFDISIIPVPKETGVLAFCLKVLRFFRVRYSLRLHLSAFYRNDGFVWDDLLYSLNDAPPFFRTRQKLMLLRILDKLGGFIPKKILVQSAYITLLERLKPDVVMVATPWYKVDTALGFAAETLNKPCWVYPEGWDYPIRPALCDYQAIFSWGPALEKDLLRINVPPQKMRRIAHPLTALRPYLPKNSEAIKQKFGIPIGSRVITMYGNATYCTGIDHQRQALKTILEWAKDQPNILVLFRALPYDNQWADLAYLRELETTYSCFKMRQGSGLFSDYSQDEAMQDPNEEVSDWIAITDVLVTMVSHACLEYGFCGKPVVMYDSFGRGEYIVKELVKSGILLAKTNKDLVQGIDEVLAQRLFDPQKLLETFSFTSL